MPPRSKMTGPDAPNTATLQSGSWIHAESSLPEYRRAGQGFCRPRTYKHMAVGRESGEPCFKCE